MSLIARLVEFYRGRFRAWRLAPPASEGEAWSRSMTRTPPEIGPPGPRFLSVSTDDLDPETLMLYPDYLERRRERAEDPEAQGFYTLPDVRPDDY